MDKEQGSRRLGQRGVDYLVLAKCCAGMTYIISFIPMTINAKRERESN